MVREQWAKRYTKVGVSSFGKRYKMIIKLLLYARDNLDMTLACLGLLLSLVLGIYYISDYMFVSIMILSMIACASYIVMRRMSKLDKLKDTFESDGLVNLLDIALILLAAVCVIVYVARPELTERPLSFIILISLIVSVLATKIYMLPDTKWHRIVSLLQIIVVGLGLEWSVLALFPSIVGQDPWMHQLFAIRLRETWDFANTNAGLPIMHTLSALGLFGGLDYRHVVMFILTPIQVVGDAVLIYLLGKELVNSKIGLLASLLCITAGWHIFFGYWVIPNSLGFTFALASAYMFLKAHKGKDWRYMAGAFAMLVVATYTHPLPVFWLWMVIGIFVVALLPYKLLYKKQFNYSKNMAMSSVGVVAIPLVLWSVVETARNTMISGATQIANIIFPKVVPTAATVLSLPLNGSAVAPFSIPVQQTTAPTIFMQNVLDKAHFPEFLFNSASVLVFSSLALIGVLYMLSKRGNVYTFTLSIVGVCAVLLAIFPQQIISGMIFSDRWCYIGQVLMSVPLAIALFLVIRNIKGQAFKLSMMGFAVGSLCFLSIIGLPANIDNNDISKNQIVRYGFNQQELDAAKWAWNNKEGFVGVDPQYSYAFCLPDLMGERDASLYIERIVPYLTSGDFSKCNSDVVLIRNEIVDKPFGWGDDRIYRLTYNPNEVLAKQGWNKVYDNGEVCGYRR